MEFDLHPSITLQTGTFNALVTPEPLVVAALNGNRELRKFRLLYACGSASRLLPAIHCRSPDFEVRRACTARQLQAIVAGSCHTVVFVEHDPSLYEGVGMTAGDDTVNIAAEVAEVLDEVGQNSLVVLYAPREDASFRILAHQADRVIYVAPPATPHGIRMHRPVRRRHPERSPAGQTSLEGV